uniref:Uncharacterized protein n=1 Tax=Cucumis melo TaxID=3656 RepID=A0A9I9E8M4_CUCME
MAMMAPPGTEDVPVTWQTTAGEAETGDSAGAWTAGSGGNGDRGAIGRPVRPEFRGWKLFGNCCGGRLAGDLRTAREPVDQPQGSQKTSFFLRLQSFIQGNEMYFEEERGSEMLRLHTLADKDDETKIECSEEKRQTKTGNNVENLKVQMQRCSGAGTQKVGTEY